jgi:hypothetical protein
MAPRSWRSRCSLRKRSAYPYPTKPQPHVKQFVLFLCERFSLAIVAIGDVVMILIFVVVEVNTAHVNEVGYGLKFRGATNVVDVTIPQGPLQSGDRIDLSSLKPEQRFSLAFARSGAQLTVNAIRDGRSFPVTLQSARPEYSRGAELVRDVAEPICFILSLGFASALFLTRPRPSTLAFYVYAILMLLKVYQTPLQMAAWPINLVSYLLLQFVYPLAQLAILFFAQRLYGHKGRTWRFIIWPAVAASVVVFIVWTDQIVWLTTQSFGIGGPIRFYEDATDIVLLSIVIAGLAYIASGAEGLERRRVNWIVAGIALAPLMDLAWALTDLASSAVADRSMSLLLATAWIDVLIPWVGLFGILAVCYGFLSRHIIDIRIAIGRAAIYAVLTAVLVVIFGAIEWLAEQVFDSTRPAVYLSLVVALGIGFAMRTVHSRFENFVDGMLFRGQRHAEEQLRRAARALSNTTSEKTLEQFLIDEPMSVLDLSAAAYFSASAEGAPFKCIASRGWDGRTAGPFDPQDALVVTLRAELGPVQLDARTREAMHLPGGGKVESLVVPLIMRGNVFGFVFYGERKDGIAFSEDERALLASIAASAAAASDHIDADRSRARIRELETRLAEAGIRL